MAAQSSKNELILGLTPSEAKVLILGIVSTNEGKVDFQLVAQKGGYKTKDSAATTYGNARRKLLRLHGENGTGESSATVTPNKKGAGAKAKKATGDDGENDESPAGVSLNTPKKTPASKRKKTTTDEEDDTTGTGICTDVQWNDLNDTPTPTPKRQRKKGIATKITPKKTAKTTKVKSEEVIKDEEVDCKDDSFAKELLDDGDDAALSAEFNKFFPDGGAAELELMD